MIFLEKTIEKVVFIDVFKQSERDDDPLCVVSQPLKDHLDALGMLTEIYFPADLASLITIFENISCESGDGLILQLSGHGAADRSGFGNDFGTFWMLWRDSMPYFNRINGAWNGGLIINASMMCYSDGLMSAAVAGIRLYHAAVSSHDSRSYQALLHNKGWYGECLVNDHAKAVIKDSNNMLEYNLGYKPYVIDLAGVIYE